MSRYTSYDVALEQSLDDAEHGPSADVLRALEAERALIAQALKTPGVFVDSPIRDAMLQASEYQSAWRAIRELSKRRLTTAHPITPPEFFAELARVTKSDTQAFNAPRWKALIELEPVGTEYALSVVQPEIVARHKLRAFSDKTTELNQAAVTGNPLFVYSEYITAAQSIGREPDGEPTSDSVGQRLAAWNPKAQAGEIVPSGIPPIDKLSGGGPRPGELVVIGGGTNVGKSYCAEQILHCQAEMKQNALHLSIEDSDTLFFARMVARHTTPPIRPVVIANGPQNGEGYPDAIVDAAKARAGALHHERTWLEARCKAELGLVKTMMRRYRYRHGVKSVIVDYLQAIQPDDPEEAQALNRVQWTAAVVNELKKTARDIGVVLYLFSQYSRESYKDGQEPTINSCKYAGDIENEAETIVLLWADEVPDGPPVLRAKLPKVKWTQAPRSYYIVHRNKVTGCFESWQDDFRQPGPPQQKQSKFPKGGRGGFAS